MATHRASSTSPSASMADIHDQTDEKKSSNRKTQYNFNFTCPFSIPCSPEAAAVRIISNLSYFRLYYTLFVWVILCITLVPKRKVSLIFLVAMSSVTWLYLLLIRLLPNSVVFHYKTIDRRLVVALLAIATMVELILTRAAVHLFVTLAAAIPVILVHAVLLRVGDELSVTEEEEAAGEFVPLVYKKTGDHDKAVDLV